MTRWITVICLAAVACLWAGCRKNDGASARVDANLESGVEAVPVEPDEQLIGDQTQISKAAKKKEKPAAPAPTATAAPAAEANAAPKAEPNAAAPAEANTAAPAPASEPAGTPASAPAEAAPANP